MRVVYIIGTMPPATMSWEQPYVDGRAFVPCNAASALWPQSNDNGAYCYESGGCRFEVRPAESKSQLLIPSRYLGPKP